MSEESFAYTPGLIASSNMYIRKFRGLPLKGEILVKPGQQVDFKTVIGRCYLEGAPQIVKLAEILNVDPEEVIKFVTVKKGDWVRKGDVIARYNAFFGLLKKEVTSPIDGYVENISELTGHVTLREPPKVIEVTAFIKGRVEEVTAEGAVIGTWGSYIQGIIGFGGEQHGIIEVVAEPDEVIDKDMITEAHSNKIIVGGALITYDALMKAKKVGVRGIVTGGAKINDLEKFLGYRIGVAITGRENIGFTLILTEGFGKLSMSEKVYKILADSSGKEAAISGATQVRAGVIRPEVIIPLNVETAESRAPLINEGKMRIGSTVRIIRHPYFGEIGTVVELPIELQKIETESFVRVVRVKLKDGRIVTIPRANVEIISE